MSQTHGETVIWRFLAACSKGREQRRALENVFGNGHCKVKEVKILKGQVYFQTSNWATSEIDPFLVISRKGVGQEIHSTALPTNW